MVLPEIRLLQSAIVLVEEMHFSRAADRLNISQSALSKQILKLERELGFPILRHHHKAPELTDAGRVFIAEAREVVMHAERSILSARAVLHGPVDILNIGKSSYTDPFLVSALQAIRLPLFPEFKVKLWSNFSNELVRQVMVGTLDLAVITGVPDKPQLSVLNLMDRPYYIAMQATDPLAEGREVRLPQMHGRHWMLLGQHANAYLYDSIQSIASHQAVYPADINEFTSPEEAAELIREHQGLAFLPIASAWRIARHGITMRPLAEDRLRLVTRLAIRADTNSRLVSDYVKAVGRKLGGINHGLQAKLPLSA